MINSIEEAYARVRSVASASAGAWCGTYEDKMKALCMVALDQERRIEKLEAGGKTNA